jgi:type IV secretory pathway TrbL component
LGRDDDVFVFVSIKKLSAVVVSGLRLMILVVVVVSGAVIANVKVTPEANVTTAGKFVDGNWWDDK